MEPSTFNTVVETTGTWVCCFAFLPERYPSPVHDKPPLPDKSWTAGELGRGFPLSLTTTPTPSPPSGEGVSIDLLGGDPGSSRFPIRHTATKTHTNTVFWSRVKKSGLGRHRRRLTGLQKSINATWYRTYICGCTKVYTCVPGDKRCWLEHWNLTLQLCTKHIWC